MNTEKESKHLLAYFIKNIEVVIGLVLIWRGIWYILDEVDIFFLGGSHFWTAVFGTILGFLILYLPDKDLKEIGKL